MSGNAPQGVRFGTDGLAPVVVQDAVSGDVLMLAYMNEDALRLTHKTGRAHYWSRGRGALWRKGETSGHEQMVDEIRVNCEEQPATSRAASWRRLPRWLSELLLPPRRARRLAHDRPRAFLRSERRLPRITASASIA